MSREQGTQIADKQMDAKFMGGHHCSLGEALP